MAKQIGVTVPDSETLSSEKSKRFTVSENYENVHSEIFFRSSLLSMCHSFRMFVLYAS